MMKRFILILLIFGGISSAIFYSAWFQDKYAVKDQMYQSSNVMNKQVCIGRFGDNANYNDCKESVLTKFDRYAVEYKQASLSLNQKIYGGHFDDKQLDSVKAAIAEYKQKNIPIFIVTFVHGFHHNASKKSENYQKFDFVLSRVRDQLDRNGQINTKLLGVYVGWQGESLNIEGLNNLTIGSRATAADIVATGQLKKRDCNKLSTLHDDIKNMADNLDDNSHMLVIGHSLGGRILSTAFMCDLENEHFQPLKNTKIATINAAVDAALFEPLYTHSTATPTSPYWVNFTSKDDMYTDWVFTAGRAFQMIPSFSSNIFEGKYTAIGHYDKYLTHTFDLFYGQIDSKKDAFKNAKECVHWSGAFCVVKNGEAVYNIDTINSCYIKVVPAGFITDNFNNHYVFNNSVIRKNVKFSSSIFDQSNWYSYGAEPLKTIFLVTRERMNDFNRIQINKPLGLFTAENDVKVNSAGGSCILHNDAHVYISNLALVNKDRVAPLHGKMWNIQTTSNAIDFAGESPSNKIETGKHSAYVATELIKMLVELTLTKNSVN